MGGASSESENRYLVRGLTGGASGESENRYLVRGLTGGASGEAENRYLVRGLTGGASGEAENRYLVRGLVVSFWAEPASIFTRSKRFFRFLLRGPLFMVPDTCFLKTQVVMFQHSDMWLFAFSQHVSEGC